jgi:hypothetical protein
MKKISKILMSVAVVAMVAVTLSSCGAPKAAVSDEKVVEMYCSGPQYLSDATALRFTAIGTSMDQMTSKKKAMSEARAGLASQIETTVKSVIDNYVKSSIHNNKEDLSNRYEGLTREVVSQVLIGTRTVCEQMTKTKDGNYKTYLCVELGGPEILTSINNRFSRDEFLKVDYDYEKFKKTFEEEMSKLGNR